MTVIQVIHLGNDYGKVAVHSADGGEVIEYEVDYGLADALSRGILIKGVSEKLVEDYND